MSWEIRVWHDDEGDKARLSIEAGQNVPDNVISDVVGSYWFEEVQTVAWEPTDATDVPPTSSGNRFQG